MKKRHGSFQKNLINYTLRVGAATVTASICREADAAIIAYDPSDQTITPGGDTLYVDLDGGTVQTGSFAGQDFSLWVAPGKFITPVKSFPPKAQITPEANNGVLSDPSTNGNFTALNSGDVIDSSRSFLVSASGTAGAPLQTIFSAFGPGTRTYIGLEMLDATTQAPRYGWADISLDPNYNLTLYQFAYNDTPNQPIAAGQTTQAVPEPASIALLATGAAGLAALRARRSRQAKN